MSAITTLNTGDRFAALVRRPSLEVWLDAISSPIVKDGSGNVSQWSDLSGKGHHAAQVGSDAMPVYVANKNGFPALYSDGAAQRKLDFSHSLTTTDPFTIIGLFAPDTGISDPTTGSSINAIYTFGTVDTTGNSVGIRHARDDLSSVSFVAYGSGSVLNGSPFTGFEAFSISFNGTNTYAYYGKTMDAESGVAAGATRVLNQCRLFNEISSASSVRTAIGWMRAVLLFKECLSDSQRNAIVTALKARYGVAS